MNTKMFNKLPSNTKETFNVTNCRRKFIINFSLNVFTELKNFMI